MVELSALAGPTFGQHTRQSELKSLILVPILFNLIPSQKFLQQDFLREKLSQEAPIYVVVEGSEPQFFTRFFAWDSAKSSMHGNSFQRKLAIVKNVAPVLNKPKRRAPVSYGGRSSSVPEKSQRSRSMSFSPDRVRVRGRSPAFNALAANFESANTRNLSTPPPIVRKLYPKSATPDSVKLASRSAAIAALTSSFDKPIQLNNVPRPVKDEYGLVQYLSGQKVLIKLLQIVSSYG